MEPWRRRPHMPQLGMSSALAPPQPCLPFASKRARRTSSRVNPHLTLTLTLTLTTLTGARTLSLTVTLTQVFREPNAMITKSNARVMSLQDGTTRTLTPTPSPSP